MMKTQLMTLGVLSLLVAATACSNHREADEPSGLARTVQFHAGVPASKTAFGEADGDSYPTYWTANDTRVRAAPGGSLTSPGGFFFTGGLLADGSGA